MQRLIYFLLILFSFSGVSANDSLRIAVISDIHYLASEIASDGKALEQFEKSSGRNVSDLHNVLNSVLDSIYKSGTEILLISGDMTNHGEKSSHLELTAKLDTYRKKGLRIFVIPGNHDINVPNAKAYSGDNILPTAGVTVEEFKTIYAPFGYSEAVRSDTASLSYLATLNDSVWLLCIDTNRYREYTTSSISGGRILPQTMQWASEILKEARDKNITVLGMVHHGLVEHMPYQSAFFADYLVENWQKNVEMLADYGLQAVFTGHFHSTDISSFTSRSSNTIFDIETGSLAQYPFPVRFVTLAGKTLSINTHFVEHIPGIPDIQEKYRQIMKEIAQRSIDSKLKRIGIPISEESRNTLTDLLVEMSLRHAKGDEKMDGEILEKVHQLALFLGDEQFDIHSFQLDFPPADNQLVIELK